MPWVPPYSETTMQTRSARERMVWRSFSMLAVPGTNSMGETGSSTPSFVFSPSKAFLKEDRGRAPSGVLRNLRILSKLKTHHTSSRFSWKTGRALKSLFLAILKASSSVVVSSMPTICILGSMISRAWIVPNLRILSRRSCSRLVAAPVDSALSKVASSSPFVNASHDAPSE